MAIPEQQLGDLSFRGVMLLGAYAFCNSKVTLAIVNAISPTLNYEVGHIASLPIIMDMTKKANIDTLVQENINLSKKDWDSFETSWDFERHPLI